MPGYGTAVMTVAASGVHVGGYVTLHGSRAVRCAAVVHYHAGSVGIGKYGKLVVSGKAAAYQRQYTAHAGRIGKAYTRRVVNCKVQNSGRKACTCNLRCAAVVFVIGSGAEAAARGANGAHVACCCNTEGIANVQLGTR